MKITVIGRQMSVWDDMKAAIEKKLKKFDRYFGSDCGATVTLSTKNNQKNLEITIVSQGTIFRSEVGDETFLNALDRAVYGIERQLRKNKTRLEKRLKKGAFDNGFLFAEEEFEEENEFRIRKKSFPIKPMSAEEAIMQMNLLQHEFYVFRDDISEKINVVYKRKDGDYGLIVPEAE